MEPGIRRRAPPRRPPVQHEPLQQGEEASVEVEIGAGVERLELDPAGFGSQARRNGQGRIGWEQVAPVAEEHQDGRPPAGPAVGAPRQPAPQAPVRERRGEAERDDVGTEEGQPTGNVDHLVVGHPPNGKVEIGTVRRHVHGCRAPLGRGMAMLPLPAVQGRPGPECGPERVEADGHREKAGGPRLGGKSGEVLPEAADDRRDRGMDDGAGLDPLGIAPHVAAEAAEAFEAFDVPALPFNAELVDEQWWVVRSVLGKALHDGLELVERGVGEIGEGPVRPEQRRLVLDTEPEHPLILASLARGPRGAPQGAG